MTLAERTHAYCTVLGREVQQDPAGEAGSLLHVRQGRASCLFRPLPCASHLAVFLSVCLFEPLSLFLFPSPQNLSPQFLSVSPILSPLGLFLFFSLSFSLSSSLILFTFFLSDSFLLCLSQYFCLCPSFSLPPPQE